jgi:hypothetical protein
MSREHATMFGCLTFHLHGAERINKLGVDVYLYTSLRSAALPIINMERSGAGNGERRNVQGTFNVQLPYLSFTRSGAERGTGKEEMSREHTMFSCLTYHLHGAERSEERGKKKRPGNIQQCSAALPIIYGAERRDWEIFVTSST